MVATALMAAVAGGASAQAPSVSGAPVSPESQSIRVTPESARLTNYLRDLAGPPAFASIIGGGLVDHIRHDEGRALMEEFAARAGKAAVQVSVRHGLAALMHRSTDYQPCECRGFGPKVEHALLETFTDRRADGTRALSVPRIAGTYAGSFAGLAWERDQDASDAALGATLSIGFTALFNIARELTGVGR